MKPTILTLNGGSSSIKFAFYHPGEFLTRCMFGRLAWNGLGEIIPTLTNEEEVSVAFPVADGTSATGISIEWLEKQDNYSLSHSFGAVFDNPDLILACVAGDGEAETGPLAAAWHSNKFLNAATHGAVLPDIGIPPEKRAIQSWENEGGELAWSLKQMNDFQLQRLGQIMKPEPGNPHETEGVLNPATARAPDGQLYLFPRLVAAGNISRIGIARVLFNEAGDPCGVERLGIALEPEADYELIPHGGGGCEDPRITFVEPLQQYLMTYTALSPLGARIAVAISKDLLHWKRLGLAAFEPYRSLDFAHVYNKDACLFPVAVPNHAGKRQMAMLHRPLFPGTLPEETVCEGSERLVDLDHESIWISYCPMPEAACQPQKIGLFNSHHRLATPEALWEMCKIGGGTPPILTRHGWLIVYHGVSEVPKQNQPGHHLRYSAGVMILSEAHPRTVLYRSPEPILTPLRREERHGIVPNVVFPTGIDRRDDLGTPDTFDLYYGMADSSIGVARLTVPDDLP